MISKGSFKLTYAAGVLTLSVKGILKMDFPSATTTGDIYTADLTGKSWTFQDAAHASPQILGRLGTTASVAWGSGGTTTSMPLFIKLVNKDDNKANIKPCLTRDPVATISPASTDNIGILGTAAATSAQTNIILGYNDNTGYNSKPMVLIGACEGTIDNSAGGSMTIGATAGRFGCNPTALDGCFATMWTFPAGQNGNQSGKLFNVADGATSLIFDLQIAYYQLTRTGRFIYDVTLANVTTNGADSAIIRFYFPFINTSSCIGSANTENFSGPDSTTASKISATSDSGYGNLLTSTSDIKDNSPGTGSTKRIRFHIDCPAF